MEKIDFVGNPDSPWWLIDDEQELGSLLAEQRAELGRALGWPERDWYESQSVLGDLFDALTAAAADLLVAPADLSREDERAGWLSEAIDALSAEEASEVEAGEVDDQPTDGASEALPTAAEEPPVPAPARKSIFKAKEDAEPVSDDGPTLEEATETVMADLDLAALAEELGVSVADLEDVVNSPDFVELVREEAARLAD